MHVLSEQKLALIERLNGAEHSLAALRSELQQREDDFQVDRRLFTPTLTLTLSLTLALALAQP